MKLARVQPDIAVGAPCCKCDRTATRQVNLVTSSPEDVASLVVMLNKHGIKVIHPEDRLCIVILSVCPEHEEILDGFIQFVKANHKEITAEGLEALFAAS